LFFWLNDVELAIERVKTRVSEGGHHTAEEVIRRRYSKGIQNLEEFAAISNYWLVINSSDTELQFIAEGNLNKEITIFEKAVWSKLNLISNGNYN